MSKAILITLLLGIVFSQQSMAALFDYKTSEVISLSPKNFDDQINKYRNKQVSVLAFFKSSDDKSVDFASEYSQLAADMKGILRITSVDCDEYAALCEKESVTEVPTVKIYPLLPAPAQKYEGELSGKKIAGYASQFVEGKTMNLNSLNVDEFIKEEHSMPKVLLFTNKKKVPVLFRALSTAFDKKMKLGVVFSSEDDLCRRYNVSEFPKILLIKSHEPKPRIFKGELKYQPIFDFLNVHAETFVTGGGYADEEDSSATKSWLQEAVPELHSKSGQDICLGVDGVLCVIYVNTAKPDDKSYTMLKEVYTAIRSKLEGRGLNYKVMWMNSSIQKSWVKKFNIEEVPQIVVLNPGKRKRFLIHNSEFTVDAIKSTFDNIEGGNAKFKSIKGGLPDLEVA